MRILVVDDDDISRTKITNILSRYGDCVEAEDGQEALCYVGLAMGQGHPFDLITMDVEMPGLKGHDVVKAIRRWEKMICPSKASFRPVKVVMLTSKTGMKTIYAAHKQSCDQYVIKPVTPENIHECLANIGLANVHSSSTAAESVDAAQQPDTIAELKADINRLTNRLEEQSTVIQALTESSKQALKAKNEFIATITHELRTPLTGILGMAQLVSMTQLDEDQQESVNLILSSGDKLLFLINELLDITLIQTGQCHLQPAEFDLRESFKHFKDTATEKAHAKGLELESTIDTGIPDALFGDSVRLFQILDHIVNNAIKFTHKGRISVNVCLQEQNRHSVVLRFTVKDTGIGISPEDQTRIFDLFKQLDGSNSKKYQGAGLGLPIAYNLTRLMGGNIYVKSQPNLGSELSFTVSLQQAGIASSEPLTARDSTGCVVRVLVVSSDKILRNRTVTHLRSWGLRSEMAANANNAFQQIADACELGDPYRIIILDDAIKTQPGGEPLANAMATDRENNDTHIVWLKKQADASTDPLTKPIDYDLLHQYIKTLLSKSLFLFTPAELVADRSRAVIRNTDAAILVVEDAMEDQLLIMAILKRMNIVPDVAANGEQALALLKSNSYDLVLLDVVLSDMFGLEIARIIRDPASDVLNHTVPIVAMIVSSEPVERTVVLTAKMNDYISKPIELKTLVDVANKWLPN